ncbi:MAG: zf-HC2 domain-containing protein [candidate division Zixibacteria bacterium]
MNCRGVSRRLSAYIDNELSPGIKDSVEEHFNSCIACKKMLSDLKAISGAARTLPSLQMPEGFKKRVMDSARDRNRKTIAVSGLKLKAAFSGFAFVGAAVVVFLLAGPKAPTVTPEMTTPDITAEIGNPAGEQSESLDFTEDPTLKIESFPIPEDARAIDFAINDSSILNDSLKIDNYILPVIEKTDENINVNVQF